MPPLRPPMIKQYVDVVAHWHDDGRIDPMMVCWPDGRTFQVDCVMGNASSCLGVSPIDSQTTAYRVRIGGKQTILYLERQGEKARTLAKWFVLIPEGRKPWRFGVNARKGAFRIEA